MDSKQRSSGLDFIAGRLHRTGLLLGPLLTLLPAPVLAQFDPSSNAVRDAYTGDATAEKLTAAREGLMQVLEAVNPSGGGNGPGGSIVTVTTPRQLPSPPAISILETLTPGSDGDLGAPGTPLTLNGTLLQPQASFTSGRAVSIGSGGTIIDTGAFELSLTGVVNAGGALLKRGSGTLALSGNNIWNVAPHLEAGRLRGSTASLATAIATGSGVTPAPGSPLAEVEFAQASDGAYSNVISGTGVLVKSAAGTLDLSTEQTNTGGTRVEDGRLRLVGAGNLGGGPLFIASGAELDLTAQTAFTTQASALSGAGNVSLGSRRLTLSGGSDSTFDGVLSGAGEFRIDSSQIVTLTGVSTYTGATRIERGGLTLSGNGNLSAQTPVWFSDNGKLDISPANGDRSIGGLQGSSGSVLLGANRLSLGAGDVSASFSGSISGSGGITKVGSGRQQLLGTNSYTGITRVDAGVLTAAPAALSQSVINNAVLELTATDPSGFPLQVKAYSGNISGTGRLVKVGSGVVWLRGSHSYSGGTEVREGVLLGNAQSLQGDILNNATTGFYQVTDQSYAGTISGNGLLVKYGPGKLTLLGANSHGGGTAFQGPLRIMDDRALGASGSALVLVDGVLELGTSMATSRPLKLAGNQNVLALGAHDLHLSGPLTGTGAVTKTGSGTLQLIGQHKHDGGTHIAEGGVRMSGHHKGNLTLAQASTLKVQVDASGRSDHIEVSGPGSSVNLQGGRLQVLAADGDYAARTRYTLITAPAVNGTFSSVSSDLAFLQPGVGIDANNVYLILSRNNTGYADLATNPSQASVGEALSRLLSGSSDDISDITNAFNTLSVSEVPAALDTVGGLAFTSLDQVGALQARSLTRQASARLLGVAGTDNISPGGLSFDIDSSVAFAMGRDSIPLARSAAPTPTTDSMNTTGHRHGVWIRGLAAHGRLEGGDSSGDTKLRSNGLMVGVDQAVSPSLTLGLLGAWLDAEIEQPRALSSSSRESWVVGAYGRLQAPTTQGALFLSALGTYGFDQYESTRGLSIGPLLRTARSSFSGRTVSVYSEAGYRLELGPTVEPFIAAQWTTQHQNAHAETGAGSLNLRLSEQHGDSLQSLLGVRGRWASEPGDNAGIVLQAQAAWAHEHADSNTMTASLAGDLTGTRFQVRGRPVARDSAQLGIALTRGIGDALRLHAGIDADLSRDQRTFAFSAALRASW
ncbi:MAG: autotransporter domain-containing protein [Gammaproteobacteria bacterium]|nr:autotransporter domain-containing protein [Gammaproteobacteria bacterium]